MRPEFLDSMSWEIAEVYGAIEDQILVNLAHYFPYFTKETVPKSSFTYQARMLAQMGQVNEETLRIISENLKGVDFVLRDSLEVAIMDTIRKTEPELYKGALMGMIQAPKTVPIAPNQMRAFQLYYKQSADKLNLVNTVMLESTKQAYQSTVSDIVAQIGVNGAQTALNIGAGEVITGVSSWNTAMIHSINRMKQSGITGFVDHAGRHWSAEAYVSMDIRTTMANTARAAMWETNESFGNDLYQVSYHDGARPLCYPWQNKVISATDNARDTVDLDGNQIHVYAQSETSYGEAAGLFGINCKHYPTPFIPGVSIIRGTPQDEEANAKTYAESQEQRRLERKIREEKRDLAMLKAQNAPEEAIKAQRAKVRQTSDDIDTFCEETGRARRQNREGVYTKRSFPAKDSYDVTEFTREQKERFDAYWKNGGAQHGFTFGQMTPNVPLVPNPPAVNVASQATTAAQNVPNMKYGKPYEDNGYRKAQLNQIEGARQTLDNAPEVAKKVWSKCADDFEKPSFGTPGVTGAHYDPRQKRTYYKSYKEAFAESTYQRKNVVWFHEYGHNIDNILGGGWVSNYLSTSYVSKDGKLFTQVIDKEIGDTLGKYYLKKNNIDLYDAVKAAQNGTGGMGIGNFTRQMLKSVMPGDEWKAIRDTLVNAVDDDAILRPLVDKWLKPQFESELRQIVRKDRGLAQDFCNFVKSRYSIYETSDVSDIYGNYFSRSLGSGFAYPFGVGHKYSYQTDVTHMAKEAFAEFFSAMVTGCDSMKGIQDFLPESYKFFEEMLGSVV